MRLAFIIIAIVAFALYYSFVCVGIRLFGMQKSYSSFAHLWKEKVPIHNMNLWSIVTMVTAMLLVPVYIELGAGTAWQFLGFLAPVWLGVVACTPDYLTNKTQRLVHIIATCFCATGFFAYAIFVLGAWPVILLSLLMMLYLAITSSTLKEDYIFWGEMVLLFSAFVIPIAA